MRIALVVVVSVALLAGTVLLLKSWLFDIPSNSAVDYVHLATVDIATSWDVEQLRLRASPSLAAQLQRDGDKFSQVFSDLVGSLTRVKDCRMENVGGSLTGISTAQAGCIADFEKATAVLDFFLVRIGDGWQIDRLEVR